MYNMECLKYTKLIIGSSEWKKDKQRNGQTKKDKRASNDLQNTTQKTQYRATRTPLKTGGKPRNDNQFLLH